MKTSHLLLVCLSLVSSPAAANPVMVVMKVSAEVTGSTHVRLRYLSNSGGPPTMTTYGTSHSEWFTNGETTSADNGSGMQTMTYQFMCDCHVPTGSPLVYDMADGNRPSYVPASSMTVTVTPSPSSSTLCDDQCAGSPERDTDGSGCSFTRHRDYGILSMVLALGLLALARRRKR